LKEVKHIPAFLQEHAWVNS